MDVRLFLIVGVIAVVGLIGAVAVIAVILFLLRGGKKKHDPDAGLEEDVSRYPPAPRSGTHRLMFEGQAVRLRLVVMAPAGRNVELSADMAESVLQAIFHGLGKVADLDKPRVRIWPGQLSQEGFAPKFFDNTARPESPGAASRWIMAAGPAKAGQKTVLLGLALEAVDPSTRGNVRMDIDKWSDKLRVQVIS